MARTSKRRRPPRYHVTIWNERELVLDERLTGKELGRLERVVRACGVRGLSGYFGEAKMDRYLVRSQEDAGASLGSETKTVVTITREDRKGKD